MAGQSFDDKAAKKKAAKDRIKRNRKLRRNARVIIPIDLELLDELQEKDKD